MDYEAPQIVILLGRAVGLSAHHIPSLTFLREIISEFLFFTIIPLLRSKYIQRKILLPLFTLLCSPLTYKYVYVSFNVPRVGA